MSKELIGLLGLVWMSLVTTYYLRTIFIRGVKPHLFSWVIWSLLCLTTAVAQLSASGGVGGWMSLAKGCLTLLIAIVAYRFGEKNITRSDWILFIAAVAAIPLWIATKEPLSAVLLATLIDLTGYIPTVRKAYSSPHEESAGLFLLSSLSSFLIIAGFESYSLTTILYPGATLTANMLLVSMIFIRRRLR